MKDDEDKKRMARTLDLIDEIKAVTELPHPELVFGIDPFDHLVRLIERTKRDAVNNANELKTLLKLYEQMKKDRHR